MIENFSCIFESISSLFIIKAAGEVKTSTSLSASRSAVCLIIL